MERYRGSNDDKENYEDKHRALDECKLLVIRFDEGKQVAIERESIRFLKKCIESFFYKTKDLHFNFNK